MQFVTAVDVLTHLGKAELATVLGGKLGTRLNPEALVAVIETESTSAFESDDVAHALSAFNTLSLAIKSASNLISGYIRDSYPNGLSSDEVSRSPLPSVCLTLVRYDITLNPHEQLTADKKGALSVLRDIAKGVVSLSSNTEAVVESGPVKISRSRASSLTAGFDR